MKFAYIVMAVRASLLLSATLTCSVFANEIGEGISSEKENKIGLKM